MGALVLGHMQEVMGKVLDGGGGWTGPDATRTTHTCHKQRQEDMDEKVAGGRGAGGPGAGGRGPGAPGRGAAGADASGAGVNATGKLTRAGAGAGVWGVG